MKCKSVFTWLFASLVFSPLSFASAEDGIAHPIDLQFAICDESGATTAQRLGFEDLVAKMTQVTYFDTNPPQYIQQGATFRTKYGKLKAGLLSSVKLRSADVASAPSGADCEWDRYGTTDTYTCEIEGEGFSPKNPWTSEQRSFAAQRIAVDWSQLVAFGPYSDEAWKATYRDYKLKLDSVNPPAPLRPLIELSVRVEFSERDTAFNEILTLLKKQGVPLCPIQEAKTLRLFRDMGIL